MAKPVRSSQQTLSDDAVLAATGRDWPTWFAFLDAQDWGGRDATSAGSAPTTPAPAHSQIVAVLTSEGVDGWWAQGITVGYEQSRGLRQPGQRRGGGFEVTASRTIPDDPEIALTRLIEAVSSAVGHEPKRVSREAKYPTARYALPDGEQIIAGTKLPTKSGTPVTITWSQLAQAELMETRRARAREILAEL